MNILIDTPKHHTPPVETSVYLYELLSFPKVPIGRVTHLQLSITDMNMPRKWAAKLNLDQKAQSLNQRCRPNGRTDEEQGRTE